MSRTLIQSKSAQSTAGVSSQTVTLTSGTTSGSDVQVFVAGKASISPPTFTVSDGTNTYSACANTRQTDGGAANIAVQVFHFNGIGSGITTITVTPSASSFMSVTVAEFSGSNVSTPFDLGTGQTGTSTSPDSGSLVAGSSADMAVSMISDDGLVGTNAQSITIPSGWTQISNLPTGGVNTLSIAVAWKTISGGALVDAAWTDSPSCTWLANVATFNAGSGGGGSNALEEEGATWQVAW